MKKTSLLVFIFCLAIFIAGCNSEKEDTAGGLTLEKTQKVEIRSAGSEDIIKTISSKKEISNFVENLQIDQWETVVLPSGLKPERVYSMYQSETLKLGEPQSKQKQLKEIASITAYNNHRYIRLRTKALHLTFKVSKNTAGYLSKRQEESLNK